MPQVLIQLENTAPLLLLTNSNHSKYPGKVHKETVRLKFTLSLHKQFSYVCSRLTCAKHENTYARFPFFFVCFCVTFLVKRLQQSARFVFFLVVVALPFAHGDKLCMSTAFNAQNAAHLLTICLHDRQKSSCKVVTSLLSSSQWQYYRSVRLHVRHTSMAMVSGALYLVATFWATRPHTHFTGTQVVNHTCLYSYIYVCVHIYIYIYTFTHGHTLQHGFYSNLMPQWLFGL